MKIDIFEAAKRIVEQHNENLKANPLLARRLDKDESAVMAEAANLFFSTKMRREMEYDRVPVGHDLGWRCYNGRKHDPESAFESGEYGDGLTQDQAYVAWLHAVDEPQPRAGIPYAGNGNSEPYEYKDDPVTFDDDLEDDAR
jgi:hypothetical protein